MTMTRKGNDSSQKKDSNVAFQRWEVWAWSEKLLTLNSLLNLKGIKHLK